LTGFQDRTRQRNTLASRAPGASLRDVMARMGHDSPRAALIYQHTNREADHGIADAMDQAIKALRRKPSKRKPKQGAEREKPAAEAS
jgi:hypothetical protein